MIINEQIEWDGKNHLQCQSDELFSTLCWAQFIHSTIFANTAVVHRFHLLFIIIYLQWQEKFLINFPYHLIKTIIPYTQTFLHENEMATIIKCDSRFMYEINNFDFSTRRRKREDQNKIKIYNLNLKLSQSLIFFLLDLSSTVNLFNLLHELLLSNVHIKCRYFFFFFFIQIIIYAKKRKIIFCCHIISMVAFISQEFYAIRSTIYCDHSGHGFDKFV